MDIIMTLTYIALVTVAFKLFRLPVNKWTVVTASLGGVYLLGWIYISMAFFHPYTPFGRIYFFTTPVAINVSGKVTEVYVTDDRPLKAGDPIFRIDPKPYASKVKSLEAQLKLAELRLSEQQRLYRQKAGTLFDLEERQEKVEEIKADLIKARFDLEQTVVRAPEDGHLVQNRLKVGTMAGKFKVGSLLTFVSADSPRYIAAFRPNGISNIKVGAEAEVLFPALPGKAFKAEVTKVWGEIAEGQLLPVSFMKGVSKPLPPGRVPVELKIKEDLSAYDIPKGASFGATVFSGHLRFLVELRRIFFRMFSWENIFNFEAI